MAVLSKNTMFDPVLVSDLITKVQGKSSLAALSAQVPIPFNGMKQFTFNMDSEIGGKRQEVRRRSDRAACHRHPGQV